MNNPEKEAEEKTSTPPEHSTPPEQSSKRSTAKTSSKDYALNRWLYMPEGNEHPRTGESSNPYPFSLDTLSESNFPTDGTDPLADFSRHIPGLEQFENDVNCSVKTFPSGYPSAAEIEPDCLLGNVEDDLERNLAHPTMERSSGGEAADNLDLSDYQVFGIPKATETLDYYKSAQIFQRRSWQSG